LPDGSVNTPETSDESQKLISSQRDRRTLGEPERVDRGLRSRVRSCKISLKNTMVHGWWYWAVIVGEEKVAKE
jgi:hypothetical protein